MDRFFNNNTVLRVFALILACGIWLAVNAPNTSGNPSPTGISERFPFRIKLLVAKSMVVDSMSVNTANVIVNGNLNDFESLVALPGQMKNVKVIADATAFGAGKHIVPLTLQNVPAVAHTVQPSSITVTLEKRVTQTRSVKVATTGQPMSGFGIGNVVAESKSVQVSGPGDAIAQVQFVQAAVSVEGASDTISTQVNLVPVDKSGKPVKGVTVAPAALTVTAHVVPSEATIPIMPQVTGTPAPGFAVSGVTVSPETVTVFGLSPKQVATMTNLNVSVDVTGLRKTQTLHVPLALPAGVVHVKPTVVNVSVHVDPSLSRSIAGVPIQIANLSAGERVQLLGNKSVNLRVSGPKSIVSALTSRDIDVYVDASQLNNQDTVAPLSVSYPQWVQVTQISLSDVPVKVKLAKK